MVPTSKRLNDNLCSGLQGMFVQNITMSAGEEIIHPQTSYGD